MIVNPIDGHKYPITSNMGKNVLKKYINTYKNGGSSEESDDSSDEDLTIEIIEDNLNDLSNYFTVKGESDFPYNKILNNLETYIVGLSEQLTDALEEIRRLDTSIVERELIEN